MKNNSNNQKKNNEWRLNNPEKYKEQKRKDNAKYRAKNKAILAAYNKEYLAEYRKKNKAAINEKNKEYYRNRRATDSAFKVSSNIRNLLSNSIRKMGYKKNSKTEQILGCSFDEFRLYIESKFESWMNWDNYGDPKDGIFEPNKTWDIDHIIPLKTATCEDDIIRLNHYTNLQPMCSHYNRFLKRANV